MQTTQNIYSFVFTILGIFLGWALTQFGQWYKSRKEDNRIRNQVLFNLLEIHHLIRTTRVNVPLLFEKIFKALSKYIPDIGSPGPHLNEFKKIFEPIIVKMMEDRFGQEFQKLEEGYVNSVNILAPVDPVIAFSLSGQTNNIKNLSRIVNNLFEGIGSHISDPKEHAQASETIKSILSEKVFDEALHDFEELVLHLAKKIGFFMQNKVKKLLEEGSPSREDDSDKIQELLGSLIDRIKSSSQQDAG